MTLWGPFRYILVNLPAKKLLKDILCGILSTKLASLMTDKPNRPSGAEFHTLAKLYN